VQAAFQKKYRGIKPGKAEKRSKGSAIGYEIHFQQSGKSAEAQLDASGKEVKM